MLGRSVWIIAESIWPARQKEAPAEVEGNKGCGKGSKRTKGCETGTGATRIKV